MRIKLKNIRMQNALTQSDLSTLIGYSSVYISQVELGNLKGSTRFWKLIQMTFNLDISQLSEAQINVETANHVN